MKKPKPQTRVLLDYLECTKYIEEKYGFETRDVLDSRSHWTKWCALKGYDLNSPIAKLAPSQGGANWFKEYMEAPDGEASRPEYRDFWHVLCDFELIQNDSVFTMSREQFEDEPQWVQDVAKLYFDEFGEGKDEIEFSVSW